MDTKFIILILGLLIFFYLLQIKHTNLAGYNLNLKTDLNPTNIGFVKPEHRLLKVLNTVSSGSKIKIDGKLNAYIYNKNTQCKKTFTGYRQRSCKNTNDSKGR